MDDATERYVNAVAGAVGEIVQSGLVGVYLHGSAVLGGFDSRRSDVDVLVVVDRPLADEQKASLGRQLSEAALPCPAKGLELSVVRHDVALWPTAKPPFELHLTTAPDDSKVVDGAGRDGDADLVLHFAVCRAAGQLIGPGLPPPDAFAVVADDLVIEQLRQELDWAVAHAPAEYALLNACRAWRFATDGALLSKVGGGEWALAKRSEQGHRALIEGALALQRSLDGPALAERAVRGFVGTVQQRLTPSS